MLKARQYDSALSTHFSTAAKFLRTESVKCSARAVIAKSRARHMHVMSLNLLTSRKSPLDLGLPMNRYTFVLPSENQNAFACPPSAQMPFIMIYSHSRTSRRSELFAKIYYTKL